VKSFKFRMQSVLEQRERQETLAKCSYAEAEAAKQKAAKLLEELLDVKKALLSELSIRSEDNFDPMETRVYQDYLQIISKSIQDQKKYLRELNITCEAEKLHMITASQNHQALVTVKDRDLQAYGLHSNRKAQKEIDEIANTQHSFRQRSQE
jgi:flagellar protein FliJ